MNAHTQIALLPRVYPASLQRAGAQQPDVARPLMARIRTTLRRRWYGIRRKTGGCAVRSRYLGASLNVSLNDGVGYEIAINCFEWRKLDRMLAACARIEPEIFIDAGASIGVYSCVLGRRQSVPRILAFEPDRIKSQRLAANLKLNRLEDKVEVHQTALGIGPDVAMQASRMPLEMDVSQAERGGAGIVGEAPVVALDDVVRIDASRIAARIDAGGYELEILMGGAQLFTRNGGYVQIAACNRQAAGVITELMAAFGWHVAGCAGNDLWFGKAS